MDQFSVQKLGLNRHARRNNSTDVDHRFAGVGRLDTWLALST